MLDLKNPIPSPLPRTLSDLPLIYSQTGYLATGLNGLGKTGKVMVVSILPFLCKFQRAEKFRHLLTLLLSFIRLDLFV